MTARDWVPSLGCPDCGSPIANGAAAYRCAGCGRSFERTPESIPVLLPRDDGLATRGQGAFYDEHEDAEHEVARPWDRPRFHAWLLEEKSRVALPGAAAQTVLVVCGGSGLDAELLARRGARVLSTDISVGAARRAQERARAREVGYDVLVADAERLPFLDRSVDVVYVHDGLHHLSDPDRGVAEMLRVARVAAVISEPTPSAATGVAMRLGVAERVEQAGNEVRRLDPARLRRLAREAGFDVARVRRYGMFYRDGRGVLTRVASRPGVFPAAQAVTRILMRLTAPIGNKLVFVAVRRG